jgi:predicted lysophospholipase L1 biosynthesis ABC-type transport system permease subunit
MALGAQRFEALALVGGQSARLTMVGMALGLLAARGGSRYLSGLLPDVAPLDPATLVFVVAAFIIVTMLASYIPARRATNVDPLVALVPAVGGESVPPGISKPATIVDLHLHGGHGHKHYEEVFFPFPFSLFPW